MYNQNEYDIIIENILKDIESMDKNTKEKWEIPLYSGNQINKAGKIISDSNSTPKEREKALKIVNNWRASHAYPLQIICSHLRRNNPNAIVVQRLKRLESITDKLDGYIARSRNQVTTFGKFLDPLADKILVLAAMVMLVEMSKLPAWIPIIVLAREFMVSGYRLIAVEKGGEVIAASKWGKLKTVTQMIAIILAILDLNAFGECFKGVLQGGDLILNLIVTILMIVQVIATIFSGIDYMKGAKKYIKD